MSTWSLRHLTDDTLTHELTRSTSDDRRALARHIAHIAEYDRRRLFLPAGCKSMFRYCVDRLGMSEDVAVQRIRVGRLALRFPTMFEAIADGRLSIACVVLAAPHLTHANAGEMLREIERRSFRQTRRLLAERFGVVPVLTDPPAVALNGLAGPVVVANVSTSSGLPVAQRVNSTSEIVTVESAGAAAEQAPGPVAAVTPHTDVLSPEPPPRRARLTPIAAGAYELVAILGQKAFEQLEACRELLGHAVPSGDLAEVLERAIALQHKQLLKRRCAATDRPRATKASASTNPRYVPAGVRRTVWKRDQGACAFTSPDGHRCGSRDRVEIDHIVAFALGGGSTVDELRLACHEHNQHLAEQAFGRDKVKARIETSRRRRASERVAREAEHKRAAARRADIARQNEELGGALRALGYRGLDLARALTLCAERGDTTPEERLKYALGMMAPNARRTA